jgi:hypothetical protein
MRIESLSRSFQMTVRKTSSTRDFSFRNTRRYFDSDQMLEESKSLSKRKLQVEHCGGRESNVQRSKHKRETNFKLPPRRTLLPMSFPFLLFLLYSSMRARAREARPLRAQEARSQYLYYGGWVTSQGATYPRANHAQSASKARAKSARSIYTMVGGLLRRERHRMPPNI